MLHALLAIIISYPTSTSGIIVLLKTPTKYREFFPTIFGKTTDFQLVFNFEQMHTVTMVGEHSSYTMMAKPIRALELHYPMIHFLINNNALSSEAGYFFATTVWLYLLCKGSC